MGLLNFSHCHHWMHFYLNEPLMSPSFKTLTDKETDFHNDTPFYTRWGFQGQKCCYTQTKNRSCRDIWHFTLSNLRRNMFNSRRSVKNTEHWEALQRFYILFCSAQDPSTVTNSCHAIQRYVEISTDLLVMYFTHVRLHPVIQSVGEIYLNYWIIAYLIDI